MLSRHGHSTQCVRLVDDTVVVTVYGGLTTSLLDSAVSRPCFFQWDPRCPCVLSSGLAPAGKALHPFAYTG
jgi:hypothetical protein